MAQRREKARLAELLLTRLDLKLNKLNQDLAELLPTRLELRVRFLGDALSLSVVVPQHLDLYLDRCVPPLDDALESAPATALDFFLPHIVAEVVLYLHEIEHLRRPHYGQRRLLGRQLAQRH